MNSEDNGVVGSPKDKLVNEIGIFLTLIKKLPKTEDYLSARNKLMELQKIILYGFEP